LPDMYWPLLQLVLVLVEVYAVATQVMVAANPVPGIMLSDVKRTRMAEPVAVAGTGVEVPLRGEPIWLLLLWLLPSSAHASKFR
jgi:hypothetical protein